MKKDSISCWQISTSASTDIDTAHIKYGYCTEFIINLEKHYDENSEHEFKAYLESIGDSIVVVSDDDIVKVHVHTNDPGLAIQKALTYMRPVLGRMGKTSDNWGVDYFSEE